MPGHFRRMMHEDDDQEVIIKTESNTMDSDFCGTKPTRCCLIIMILQFLVIVGLAVALAVVHVKVVYHTKEVHVETQDVQESVCNTEDCLVAAGEILSNMNSSVNPCEDFYNYACGNFIEKQFLRPAENTLTLFRILGDESSKIIYKELSDLNKTSIFGKESTALAKVKIVHKLCMDETRLQQDGHKPLVDAMLLFGEWPIAKGEFKENSWNFTEQMVRLHMYALSPLLSISVDADEKNSSANVLNFYQHGLTLSSEKEYNMTYDPVQNQLKKEAFINYGIEVARLLGTNESVIRPVMEEIYEVEARLAAIYVPSKVIRNPAVSYHKMVISMMQELLGPHIQLVPFLNTVTNRTDFTDSYMLVSSTMSYFDNLKVVLDEYLQGDKKRIMNNYLSWYFVHRNIVNLGSDFQFARLILSSVTDGTNSIDERWKICTSKMDGIMGRVTGAMFIENRFGEKDRDAVTDIVTRVKDALVENLGEYKWMDEETAKTAVKKAKAMDIRIGYPDYITDATKIDKYYEELQVADNLFNSVMEYQKWTRKVSSSKLDKAPDPSEWQMTAAEVNAYYNPIYNIVALPAGILRRPFFDTSLPLAWNFGGMGSVIGHEITHGFDDQGSQFDASGNLANWWTNKSATEFSKAKQCFVGQYSKYDVAGTPLNGELCLGENIADNGGVAISYKAYLQALEDTQQKPMRFSGLNFTDHQLFFLSFAQIWCMKSTPEYDQTSISYNSHSPSKFRVQGTYSNSPGFSKAFQCKEGSPYNPPNKCKIW